MPDKFSSQENVFIFLLIYFTLNPFYPMLKIVKNVEMHSFPRLIPYRDDKTQKASNFLLFALLRQQLQLRSRPIALYNLFQRIQSYITPWSLRTMEA